MKDRIRQPRQEDEDSGSGGDDEDGSGGGGSSALSGLAGNQTQNQNLIPVVSPDTIFAFRH
jgi:hypothetical protein